MQECDVIHSFIIFQTRANWTESKTSRIIELRNAVYERKF